MLATSDRIIIIILLNGAMNEMTKQMTPSRRRPAAWSRGTSWA
jgi:hypothetical protein